VVTYWQRSSEAVSGSKYVSLWLDEALALEQGAHLSKPGQFRSESLPKFADVVIIGGGFTGLWTALRLAEQAEFGIRICIIEKKYCGYGASGRNGGIAEPSWAKLPRMIQLYGKSEGVRLAAAVDESFTDLVSFCREHEVDVGIRTAGHLWVATNGAQMGSWERARVSADECGHDVFTVVDREEAQALSGSSAVVGGVLERSAATIHPGKLVRQLRRLVLEKGIEIYEDTAMVDIRVSKPPVVETNRGVIRAGKVVIAMNAWSAAMKEVKSHLFVTSSDIVATDPLDDGVVGEGLWSGVGISDSRRLILYWRSTPDHRLVFGKGGGWMSIGNRVDRRFNGPSHWESVVKSRLFRVYPDIPRSTLFQSWCGPIDYSVTGLPYFGRLSDASADVFIGVGYSGTGVVQSVLGGRVLAALVLGRDDRYSSLPVTRRWTSKIPPEPLRSLGAPIVRRALAKKELFEDAEERPSAVLGLLASLDPTTAPTQA